MMKSAPFIAIMILLASIPSVLAQTVDCVGAIECEMRKMNMSGDLSQYRLKVPFYTLNRDFWTKERIDHAQECGHTFNCGLQRGLTEAGINMPVDIVKGKIQDEMIQHLEKNRLGLLGFPVNVLDVHEKWDAFTPIGQQFLYWQYPEIKPKFHDEYIDGFNMVRELPGAILP